MADETPGTGTPAPEAPITDAAGEHAKERFEKLVEKAGIPEAAPAADRPTGGVPTPETPPPGAGAQSGGEPDLDRAHGEFGKRLRERREERRQAALARVLERLAGQAAEAAPAAEPAAAEAGPEDNPYDRDTDYWSWYAWEQEALKKGILGEFKSMLSPVLTAFERQQQMDAQRAEAFQRQQAQEAWRAEMAGLARDAHETYLAAAPDEAAGYMDRVSWLVGDDGHPGDPARGIPARQPSDGALTLGFEMAFPRWDPKTIRALARSHVDGMMMLSRKYNEQFPDAPVNPAAALDRFTRVQIAAAGAWYGNGAPAAGNGNGNGVPAPAPPPSPARTRVAALKGAAASGVAGTGAETTRSKGDLESTLRLKLSSGELGVDDMREICRQFIGPPNRQNLTELSKRARRIAHELQGQAG